VSVGRIALGALGVLCLLAAKTVWSGHALVGLKATQHESGDVFYGLTFGTRNTFSAARAERLGRAPKVRAAIVALVGGALIGGIISVDLHQANLKAFGLAVSALVIAALATLAALCIAHGLVGLYFGARSGWVAFRMGRVTVWFANQMTRNEARAALAAAQVIEVDDERERPTEAERFFDEGLPKDPLEEAGQRAIASVLPSRLISVYLLALGVLLLAEVLPLGTPSGAAKVLLDGASTIVWGAAFLVLLRTLFSENAPEGASAALSSVVGLAIGWAIGVTPGPIEAVENVSGLLP
jgi:hypothetical protein